MSDCVCKTTVISKLVLIALHCGLFWLASLVFFLQTSYWCSCCLLEVQKGKSSYEPLGVFINLSFFFGIIFGTVLLEADSSSPALSHRLSTGPGIIIASPAAFCIADDCCGKDGWVGFLQLSTDGLFSAFVVHFPFLLAQFCWVWLAWACGFQYFCLVQPFSAWFCCPCWL